MKTKTLVVLLFVAVFGSVSFGQVCPTCPLSECPPQVIIGSDGQLIGYAENFTPQELQAVEGTNVEDWYKIFTGPDRQPTESEKALAAKIKFTACRAYQGNGCGTASFCGRDSEYTYYMSNAHVASSKIGSQTRLQSIVNGKLEQFNATLIEVAYSSVYRTDWALLRASADQMKGIEPVLLSKSMPDPDADTATWGHPKCQTTRGHSCKTVKFGKVWLWLPNSIGGQSGSAVVQFENGRPVQKGLLTWSEGGYGSGQFTATIFEQSQNRTNVGEMRTGNEAIPLEDVSNPFGVELTDTYSVLGSDGEALIPLGKQEPGNPGNVELEDKWGCLGDPREVSLRNYPIWHDPTPTDPNPPTDPVPPNDPCPPCQLPDADRAKLESAKKLIDEVLQGGK